jgi:uncharacterized Zn finger protein
MSHTTLFRPPFIDFDAIGALDLARLERGLELRAERFGTGRYRVDGGQQPHWVDLYTAELPRCDCGDHLWREQVCKHILAALLREGDERVLAALRELVRSLRHGTLAAA